MGMDPTMGVAVFGALGVLMGLLWHGLARPARLLNVVADMGLGVFGALVGGVVSGFFEPEMRFFRATPLALALALLGAVLSLWTVWAIARVPSDA